MSATAAVGTCDDSGSTATTRGRIVIHARIPIITVNDSTGL